jgi:hypothetical protein
MKVSAWVSPASLRLPLVTVFLGAAALLPASTSQGQQGQPPRPAEAPATAGPAAPITALVEQIADLFPRIQGEVLEVQAGALTLDVGRKNGARAGLELEAFRTGREIKHPRSGQILGRTEETLGTVRITEVQ